MDRNAHPLNRRRRAARTVVVVLLCGGCGLSERWPLPPTAHAGRCTCSRCGGQLREHREPTPVELVREVAG